MPNDLQTPFDVGRGHVHQAHRRARDGDTLGVRADLRRPRAGPGRRPTGRRPTARRSPRSRARRPTAMALTVVDPGYSTARSRGGLYAPEAGGSLRAALTLLANARHVALPLRSEPLCAGAPRSAQARDRRARLGLDATLVRRRAHRRGDLQGRLGIRRPRQRHLREERGRLRRDRRADDRQARLRGRAARVDRRRTPRAAARTAASSRRSARSRLWRDRRADRLREHPPAQPAPVHARAVPRAWRGAGALSDDDAGARGEGRARAAARSAITRRA